ncbi:MAG TPA: pilus assembly protein TadG-related protein [Ornithinicoccus sp.]|nr:pilus assembly protein TadG-related protein [Ornithinicoccus sp.]
MTLASTASSAAPARAERGQASVLFAGMVAVVLMLVLGVVSVTSVQLSRIHLLDAADAAALDAADAIDDELLYGQGLGEGVPLTDASVLEAAETHLRSRERPARLGSWWVAAGTGSPDGRTAVVRLQGVAEIPLISPVLAHLGGGVTITVESRARSDLE